MAYRFVVQRVSVQSNSPSPRPSKVPFGTVWLAVPVSPAVAPRRSGCPGGCRLYDPRVEIPLLTMEGLRTRGPGCDD
jgi:hypothetical protein